MVYLRSTSAYRPLITVDIWEKKTKSNGLVRGLSLTATETTEGLTVDQKVQYLIEMLEVIARYVPCYLRNDIVNNSTCFDDVWAFIRKYFGFRRSESNFMKFYNVTWEQSERPERLYQRLLSHLQDNLLTKEGKLSYQGKPVVEDEEMSPTVERLAVLRWLELMHPKLPGLVADKFATSLNTMSLVDLQPQIVDSLEAMLEQLRSQDAIVGSTSTSYRDRFGNNNNKRFNPGRTSRNNARSGNFHERSRKPELASKQHPKAKCPICVAEDRPYRHSLAECRYLSQSEKRQLIQDLSARVARVDIQENGDEEDCPEEEFSEQSDE